MSLDVHLYSEDGALVYSANVTHNLGRMAREAGVYMCVWRPEEIGATKAGDIVENLKAGICALATNRAHFEQFNPENGWGSWERFVPWLSSYLDACRENPEARIEANR